jgi:hypothetical protein
LFSCVVKQHSATQLISSFAGDRKVSQFQIPCYSQASKYETLWEPYIAANLHLYTVPLAIFLRRARELDFSPAKFESSIRVLKRVFRVFSPAVVDALSTHLSGASKYTHLVLRHVENLGQCAPPQGSMSLASCQPDMHSLLEEMYLQHLKKVRELGFLDKIAASIEGLVGKGIVSGEEKNLEGLVERAKLIVRLPLDYEIFPGGAPASSSKGKGTDEKVPLRTNEGYLTDSGRDQIIRGLAKCSPADVSYVGDKMRARAGSHEIALLVDLSIWLSDYLNQKLASVENMPKVIRLNLRFLSDYRNLLFIGLTAYVFLKLH